MPDQLEPAIARIFDNDGNIVGMAFLVGPRHLNRTSASSRRCTVSGRMTLPY